MSNPKNGSMKLLPGLLILVVIPGIVYLLTLCPTIYVGDSGELIAASWTFGIPHAPGYPLFTMIGYFFAHAPLGDNPAVRMNFMTALFGILSLMVLYRLITVLTGEYLLSLFACLVIAFGRITWSQSVTTEVYTLNNLVVCLALLFIVLAATHTNRRYLFIGAFLSGLALTTHQTSLLILPGSLWLMIKSGLLPLKGRKKDWIICFLLYFLGFAVYLYLPIAAQRNPAMNWGNPSTAQNFFKVLFSPAFTQVNEGYFLDHLKYLFQIYFTEQTILGGLIAIIGMIAAFQGNTDSRLKALVWIFLTYVIFFLLTLKPVYINLYKLNVYYMPTFMLSTIFIAVGARHLLSNITQKSQFSRESFLPILTVLLVGCAAWNLSANWSVNNKSDDHLAEWYADKLLLSCNENSILICNFDDLFLLMYMQEVLEVRPDVTVLLTHFPKADEQQQSFWKMWLYDKALNDPSLVWTKTRPMFFKSSAVESIIEQFIDENIDKRPIFFTFYKIPPLEMMDIDFRFEPAGLCYRVNRIGQSLQSMQKNLEIFRKEAEKGFFDNLFVKHHNEEEDFILVRLDQIIVFNATLQNEIGNKDDALFLMNLAVKVNPLSWENWSAKADIEEQLGKPLDAVKSIENIVNNEFRIEPQITPAILDWRYRQAKILHNAGMNLEAADILNQFYPMDPRQPREIQVLAKEVEDALKKSN